MADVSVEEAEAAEFLIWNIRAYDNGTLDPQRIALLDSSIPNWRSEDMRFGCGLFGDWSMERMASYLGERMDAYDAGTLCSTGAGRVLRLALCDDVDRSSGRADEQRFTLVELLFGVVIVSILSVTCEVGVLRYSPCGEQSGAAKQRPGGLRFVQPSNHSQSGPHRLA